MTDFNLRQLVSEVLNTSLIADPGDLAAEVSSRIDDADCRTALDQALRHFVREEITRRRMRYSVEPSRTAPKLAPVLKPARRPVPARSAKVTAIRNAALTGRLNDRISVGEKKWRLLGDCTFEDLMYAAAERRDLAERTSAKAREFTRLAEAVKAAGVARVRDLPAEQLAAVVGGAAA